MMGKKYIIELEDKPFYIDDAKDGEELYIVKGFRSLVFDRNGLDKLEEYKPKSWLQVGDEIEWPIAGRSIVIEISNDVFTELNANGTIDVQGYVENDPGFTKTGRNFAYIIHSLLRTLSEV